MLKTHIYYSTYAMASCRICKKHKFVVITEIFSDVVVLSCSKSTEMYELKIQRYALHIQFTRK